MQQATFRLTSFHHVPQGRYDRRSAASAVIMLGLLLIASGASASMPASTASVPTSTATPPAHADGSGERVFAMGLLDEDQPRDHRVLLFAQLLTRAEQGDPTAQDLAGSLYWRGERTRGCPVERNLAQARLLLGNAVLGGHVDALAKLAELELEAGRPFEAMIWAQLYGHYGPMEKRDGTFSTSYLAYLLKRLFKKIPDARMKQVGRHVDAFAARYDARIRKGLDGLRDGARDGNIHRLPTRGSPHLRVTAGAVPAAGVADYIVEYGADGQPKDFWNVSAFPDDRLGRILEPALERTRVNAVATGSPGRTAYIALVFDDQRYTVK